MSRLRAACQPLTALLLVLAELAAGTARADIPVGLGDFSWDAGQGRQVQVWTYRPESYTADDPIVFVMHGMLRNGETYRQPWIALADENPCLVVVPEFSKQSYPVSRMYQFGNLRDASGDWNDEAQWSFTAIEQIFDHLRQLTGSSRQGYAMFGHSAGSQFAHRMSLFATEMRAELIVAANAGSYTLPTFEVAYPYGLGGTPLDDAALAERLSRPLLVLLGTADNDPNSSSLPRSAGARAQGPHRVSRGELFYQTAQRQAERLGISLSWTKQMVPGVGHDNKKMAPAAAEAIFEHTTPAAAP